MGGIWIDKFHRTNISGLYAAGECACQYHGANRLGGNSTLGAIFGGKTAAGTAAAEMADFQSGETPDNAPVWNENVPLRSKQMRDVLLSGLSILRNETDLKNATERLDSLPMTQDQTEINRRLLAKAMLLSALERRESRGAHTRTDYPDRDDEHFRKTSIVQIQNGEIVHHFAAIGKGMNND